MTFLKLEFQMKLESKKDIKNVIVRKPWGREYCIYENKDLSVWHLTIMPGQKTSLHCHPNKKTALILLNNKARINLIERGFEIEGLSKIMLRNGMFHQTHNCYQDPINLIEVETPNDKFDLIRIEDDYGRKNKSFEDESQWEPKTSSEQPLKHNLQQKISGLNFKIENLKNVILGQYHDESVVVVLGKSAFSSKKGEVLCPTGEAVTFKIIKFLNERFKINNSSKALVIWK